MYIILGYTVLDCTKTEIYTVSVLYEREISIPKISILTLFNKIKEIRYLYKIMKTGIE